MNDDIWYIIFSIILDYPKEPEHTDHPIQALAILRCRPYAYPTDDERKMQRVVLRQVCRRWRDIVEPEVDAKPEYPFKDQDLYRLVHDDPKIVTLRLTQMDWSRYTMAQLSTDALAIRHLIILPLMEECQPTDFVIRMNLLTTLSMEFSAIKLPFDQWNLPSLRTFGFCCHDQTPEELQSLLCNVGKTITTLSYEANSYSSGTDTVTLAVPEDIWVWCPLMLNLRICARNFSVLRPPPTGHKPVTIYIIDFDIAHGTAGLNSQLFRQQVADWGQTLDKVSFGTTWSTFFSKMTRIDSYDFAIFMRALGQNRCQLHDREGVSSKDIDMDSRFDRACEIYRRNRYY